MGKRGDKRRKKVKDLRRRKAIPYEGFTYGPFTLERFGRYVRFSVDQSHPDASNFREAIERRASDAPEEYRRKREDLRGC